MSHSNLFSSPPDVGPLVHVSQQMVVCGAGDVCAKCSQVMPSGQGALRLPRSLLLSSRGGAAGCRPGFVVRGNSHGSISMLRVPHQSVRQHRRSPAAVLLVPTAPSPNVHAVLADKVLVFSSTTGSTSRGSCRCVAFGWSLLLRLGAQRSRPLNPRLV